MAAPSTGVHTGQGSVADPGRHSPDGDAPAVGHGHGSLLEHRRDLAEPGHDLAEHGHEPAEHGHGSDQHQLAGHGLGLTEHDHDHGAPTDLTLGTPVALGTPTIGHHVDPVRDARLHAQHAGTAGMVHSWELVTAVDGPGTRLTIFLSGCALRCQYCQNPDTWKMRDGIPTTLDEITARIDRYAPMLLAAHGGVTLSGGEPLLQAGFAAQIFRHCKSIGLHTALDTSGFLGARASEELLDDTDLVLLDVKSGLPDTYREVTSRELAPTLAFGRRLAARGNKIWVRYVLVPGLTDAVDNVDAVADYVAGLQLVGSVPVVERVEILPFHQMGESKWHELGVEYPLEGTKPPSTQLIDRVRAQFQDRGLAVF